MQVLLDEWRMKCEVLEKKNQAMLMDLDRGRNFECKFIRLVYNKCMNFMSKVFFNSLLSSKQVTEFRD